jgi:3-hydroxyisobutyrate dehydrogenase-like beta-hydroxyacid dehydrogenase
MTTATCEYMSATTNKKTDQIQLSDDAAVSHTIATLTSSPSPIANKTIVNTTTITPALASSLTTTLAAHSATYVSAPVFGATPLATSGTLLIAVAGAPAALAALTPFLTGVLCRAVLPAGTDPAKALALKAAGNYLTAGLMLLLSEAHVLAANAGLSSDALDELVAHNFGDYASGVSLRLSQGAYCPAPGDAPRSGLELGIKDVGIGVAMAEAGVLSVGEAYLEAAAEAKAWGDDRARRMDSSSVYGVVRQRAGLEFETDLVKARDGQGQTKDK